MRIRQSLSKSYFCLSIIYTCLFLFSFESRLYAQNLVPDPGFEIVDPTEFTCSSDGINQGMLIHWYQPNTATTDLWSLNHQSSCGFYPLLAGENPIEGKNNIGVIIYSDYTGEDDTNYREYVSTKLESALKPGHEYTVKMYVSLPDINAMTCNNLGALFTTQAIHRTDYRRIVAEPQVVEKQIITDTSGWQLISGCFTADSAYQYLTLGNFAAEGKTKTQEVIPDYSKNNILEYYYFIDLVSVEETLPPPQAVNLPGDTLVCLGEKLELNVSQPGATYRWQDGSTSARYTVSEPGYYWVEVRRGICQENVMFGSFQFGFYPEVDLGADTILCEPDELVLNARHPAGMYQWNTGEISESITVRESGLYSVEVQTPACTFTDSIQVTFAPCPGMIPNLFTPNGDGINETFYIEGTEYGSWTLEIFNRWGKKVFTSSPYRNEWKAEGLPAGVYFYRLSGVLTGKILSGWVEVRK